MSTKRLFEGVKALCRKATWNRIRHVFWMNHMALSFKNRSLNRFVRYIRRQELVASGDSAQIEVEIKALLREIHSTQKHADELEASRATCSKEAWAGSHLRWLFESRFGREMAGNLMEI